MAENKSSVSKKHSYKEIGEFWDSHDLTEFSEKGEEVEFSVDLQSDVHYYALEDSLSSKLHTVAKRRGVSTETLINLGLMEKINGELSPNR